MRKHLRRKQPGCLLATTSLFLFLCTFQSPAQNGGASIFRDDFNGTALSNLWQQPTSWNVANQTAFLFEGGDRWLKTATAYTQSSYIIETAAFGFTNNYYRSFKVTFGQQDPSGSKMYVVNFQPHAGGILSLGVSSDNFYYPQVLDQGVLYPNVTADKIYKFKIARYTSGLIQVYVDRGKGYGSIPFLEAIDSTYRTLGRVSWREDTETFPEAFYVDWISAVTPTVEKPAVKEKPAEDDLITQVTAETGRPYTVAKLATGTKAYTDRSYTITSFPAHLNGASLLQTAMDDKHNKSPGLLTSFLMKPAIVYIGYDPRARVIPEWLQSWTKTGERIMLTDPGTPYVDLYSKLVDYGPTFPNPFILGGNLSGSASGAQMNFFLAAVERPETQVYEAEKATISGGKTASNHPGYSGTGFVDYLNATGDYIEWNVTVDVPGTYNVGIAFANGGSTNRPLEISLNDIPVTTLLFEPIGTWPSWAFTSGPNVYLTRGSHKIRATATGSSGPNVDFLSLFYASDAPPTNSLPNLITSNASRRQSAAIRKPENSVVSSFPNPFMANTILSYTVEKKTSVNVSLLTAQGFPIQVLENKVKAPGKYTLVVEGSRLAAGTYFYRVQKGALVSVGKLVKM